MDRLGVICPTRNRPDTCDVFVKSCLSMSQNTDFLIYIDTDDPQLVRYSELVPSWIETGRVFVTFGPPIKRGPAVEVLHQKHRDYRAYLITSDDAHFERDNWEAQVWEIMDSWGDDIGAIGLQSEDMEEYLNWVIVSRKWIDTLGYFNYPQLQWFCQDTVIQTLAEALGRCRMVKPPVVTHYVQNHPDVDGRIKADAHAFLWWAATQFGKDLVKLKAAMNGG